MRLDRSRGIGSAGASPSRASPSRSVALILVAIVTAATAIADEPLPLPSVPDGFSIERVAGPPDIHFPMFAAFDDRGRLFVAESSGLDLYAEITALTRKCRVSVLEDRDGDGRYEHSQVFADKLVFPMGLAWRDGRLYVSDPPDLVALEDSDGDGAADRRETILTGFGHKDNGSLHGLIFGPDGLLYLTMGSPDGYRLALPDGGTIEGESGALIRCLPDGSRPEVVCRGFVNLVEAAITPRGDLFGTDNWFQLPTGGIRDALIDMSPGGLYPYHPEVGTPHPVTGEPLPPLALFPAVALSGVLDYRGGTFPQAMLGNLFTAQHNARSVQRHELVPEGSTFRTIDHDFVTSDDPDFHPSDVIEDADGSMLVIDTGSWYVHHCPTGKIRDTKAPGGIYRVRAVGAAPIEDPWGLSIDWNSASLEELAARLADPRWAVREKAQRTLVARGWEATPILGETLMRNENRIARQLAAFALGQIRDPLARRLLDVGLKPQVDPDAAIAVLRALERSTAWPAEVDSRTVKAVLRCLLTESHAVRRAAADCLAALRPGLDADSSSTVVAALVEALAADADRFLEHALIHALHRTASTETLRTLLQHANPRVQKAGLVLLSQHPRPHEALSQADVVARLAAEDAELRQAAIGVLLRRPEWSDSAVELLEDLFSRDTLADDQRLVARALFRAFEHDETVQRLAARLAGGSQSASMETRVVILESFRETALPATPETWIAALEAAIDDSEPRVRLAAIESAAVLQLTSLDDRLAAIVDSGDEPAEIRTASLRALIGRRPDLGEAAFELIAENLDPAAEPLTRLASAELAARAALSDEQIAAILRLVADDPLISPAVLLPALGRARDPAVAIAALDYLEANLRGGWKPSESELAQALASLPPDAADRSVQLLTLLNEVDRLQRERLAEFEPLLAGGDADRGREIFFGKRVACGTCHSVGNEGGRVAPDLTRLAAIRAGRDILESVLFPSSTIAQGYDNYQLVTADGRILSGVISRQTDGLIVVRDSSGAELRLAREVVAELHRLPTSLMPQGLERNLTPDEFRDLAAFLQRLK